MTMTYLVEAVDPKRGKERKVLVRRWIVSAMSGAQAVDMVVSDLVNGICDSRDGEETRRLVENRVRAESYWIVNPESPVYRLRNELR